MSRRLGQDKPLLPLSNKPVVAHCLDALVRAGLADIVVMAGRHNLGNIREALQGYAARIILNGIPGSDMAGSVRIGLASINLQADAAFVFPCDYPLVAPGTLVAMIGRFEEDPSAIVIPVFSGRKGHPTLFPKKALQEIRNLPTLREVIAYHRGEVVLFDTPDEGTVLDIDNWEDYRVLQDRFARKNPGKTASPVHHAGSREENR